MQFIVAEICYTRLLYMEQIRTILKQTSNLRWFFVIIAATSVLGALISLVTPVLIKLATDWIVDIVAGQAEFSWGFLGMLFAGLLMVGVASVVVGDIGGWFGDVMAVRVRHQLSAKYYRHLLTLPQRYYDGEVTGKIINRLSRAVTEITNFLQFFSNNLLQLLLTVTITIVILSVYSWPLAILFLVLVPVNLKLTAKTSVKWQKLEGEKNTHFDIASGRFAEVVGQMRLVKSFGTETREHSMFDDRVAQMVDITKVQSRHWHVMNAWRGLIFGSVFAAIYALLFYETARGELSVGDMVMLIALVQQAAFPLRNLSFFVDNYQRAVANSRDYLAAMSEVPEVDAEPDKQLKVSAARVAYRNVSFGYEDGDKVLSDISFEIEPGQKLALVGESGGGKSTIANLLMRLYDVDDGAIEIDGIDISTVSRASVRQSIATVFQDATLFSGTIRDNIAYATPEASEESIIKAARAANAWTFISKFADGLDTEIGERGIKLSGGQKQRITIARALLKDAPILILDEATSALDSRAEAEVQQALDRLMKNRTTLIIAHRLSTIAHVDKIVTLRDGRVDEVGSPKQLAVTKGIYAQLLKLQLGDSEQAKQQLAAFDITTE